MKNESEGANGYETMNLPIPENLAAQAVEVLNQKLPTNSCSNGTFYTMIRESIPYQPMFASISTMPFNLMSALGTRKVKGSRKKLIDFNKYEKSIKLDFGTHQQTSDITFSCFDYSRYCYVVTIGLWKNLSSDSNWENLENPVYIPRPKQALSSQASRDEFYFSFTMNMPLSKIKLSTWVVFCNRTV